MLTTRNSVLEGALPGGDDPHARRFVELYQPLIRGTLVKLGVYSQDVDDLTQDVLLKVVRALPSFHHNGKPGAFRTWLRVIIVNSARELWRRNNHQPAARGGSDFLQMVEQFEDPKSESSAHWDEEHDKQVLRGLLKRVEPDFGEQTMQIFRRLVFDEASSQQVATELKMEVGTVHAAKSRVLRRLREAAEGLLDFD